MAAPRQSQWVGSPAPDTSPRPSKRPTPSSVLRRKARERRGFVMLVVVPVLLMLGSVYLHTVSGGLSDRVAELEDLNARSAAERERLEVQVADLSSPGRIRPLAREELNMRDAEGADLKVYGKSREDGRNNGGEKKRENPQ